MSSQTASKSMLAKRGFAVFASLALACSLVPASPLRAFADDPINYIEKSWNESKKVVETNWPVINDYTPIKSSSASWYDIGTGFYVVQGSVTMSEKTTLRVSGDAKIILFDDATLTVGDGVYIKDGATLSIHARSTFPNMGGPISKPGNGPGIGGMKDTIGGNLVVHGGYIDAKGGTNTAGIGGGKKGSAAPSPSTTGTSKRSAAARVRASGAAATTAKR